jgi:hypothetical protein
MGCILKSVVNGSDPAAAFAGVLAQSIALPSIGKSNGLRHRLCRKVAFWRQNPKMGSRKINDFWVSTFLFSVICDRAAFLTGLAHL